MNSSTQIQAAKKWPTSSNEHGKETERLVKIKSLKHGKTKLLPRKPPLQRKRTTKQAATHAQQQPRQPLIQLPIMPNQ